MLKGGKAIKLPQAKLHGLLKDDGPSRMGLVVGKKVGHAPRRNRIKRLFKEAFRKERGQFSKPMDVVVKVFPGFKLEDLEVLGTKFRELNQCCVGSVSDS